MSYTFVQEPVLKYPRDEGPEVVHELVCHECLIASNSTGNDYKYMLI